MAESKPQQGPIGQGSSVQYLDMPGCGGSCLMGQTASWTLDCSPAAPVVVGGRAVCGKPNLQVGGAGGANGRAAASR